MLFSAKNKSVVFDRGEQTTLIARVSGLKPPLVIEEIVEIIAGDEVAEKEAISKLVSKKGVGYIFSLCGVSPDARFVRRATLDPKRYKEEHYLSEVVNGQFRIDPEKNTIAVLNAFEGTEFDLTKVNVGKEVIFCGMPNEDVKKNQKSLLGIGLYPQRMELSSVAALGAVADYLRFSESNKPTIVLEIGAQSTQSYIVSPRGLEATRPIAVGLEAMVPVVQKELGLKDEDSARKLFFSNTFDFTGMGASLCKRLLKELQSSMGFFEVQTGQSISQLVCTVLPTKLSWLEAVIASQVGVSVFQPDFGPWLNARKITLGDSVPLSSLDARKLAMFGLMMQFNPSTDAIVA
jgi:hypothetical protein